MEKRGDAPKIVNVAVWTTAVAGAFVFALTIGIGLYNTVNSPISADTAAPATAKCALYSVDGKYYWASQVQNTGAQGQTGYNLYSVSNKAATSFGIVPPGNLTFGSDNTKCAATAAAAAPATAAGVAPVAAVKGICATGTKDIAINNYPNTYFNTKTNTHAPFESKMGNEWRCSEYCIPGIDLSKPTNDLVNQTAVAKYLDGATVDGQPINVINNEKAFTDLTDGATMTRTVILPDVKDKCLGSLYTGTDTGGDSINYKNLILKGQTVAAAPAVPNNTVQETQAKVTAQKQYDAAAKAQTAAELQARTEAGATGDQVVGTKSRSGPGSKPKPKAKAPNSNTGGAAELTGWPAIDRVMGDPVARFKNGTYGPGANPATTLTRAAVSSQYHTLSGGMVTNGDLPGYSAIQNSRPVKFLRDNGRKIGIGASVEWNKLWGR